MDGAPAAARPSALESGAIALTRGVRTRALGGAAIALLALADMIETARDVRRGSVAVPAVVVACAALAALGWYRSRRGTRGDGQLHVGRDTLAVTVGARTYSWPLDAIAQGSYANEHVQLDLRGGDRVRALAPSRAAADAWLAALGLDAARRTLAVPLAARSTLTVALLAYVGAAFGVVPTLVALARAAGLSTSLSGWLARWALFASVALAVRFVGRGRAVVGTDGVAVRPYLGAGAFVPMRAIADVRVENDDVLLVRNDGGTTVRLATRSPASIDREALETRLRAAREVAESAAGPTARALEALDRQGRPVAEWRAAVRQLTRLGADTYRAIGLQPRELLAVLEDPRAAPERRIAAALALADRHDAETRTRIRVAAETTAAPEVRVALGAIADGAVDDAPPLVAAIERAVPSRAATE